MNYFVAGFCVEIRRWILCLYLTDENVKGIINRSLKISLIHYNL